MNLFSLSQGGLYILIVVLFSGFLTAFSALYIPETNGEDMQDNIEETKKFLSKDNSKNNRNKTTNI